VSIQSRDLVVRLMAQSNGFEKGMKSAAASADVFAKELEKIDKRQTDAVAHVAKLRAKHERESAAAARTAAREAAAAADERNDALATAGEVALVAGGAMAAGLALATAAAVQWESAWAGVTKTVDGSAEQMQILEEDLRALARTLPATHTEIAAVAEAAGQLGVRREDIASFTKTMIDLGETTNLTAEEAATSIAQIANVMGTSGADVDNFASALVALGNAGASTEADILDTAKRLAGAGKLIGASEADILALGNAMASMGIEAELGGGAMSRTILKIYSAVQGAGAQLNRFAAAAGMSASEFATAFENDPVRAVNAFIQGLNNVEQSGGNVMQTLGQLGIEGTQDLQVLLRLKGANDLLAESLDLGAEAWEANIALAKEANKRYETTEAKVAIARNSLNDFAIDLGNVLMPALAAAAEGVAGLGGWLSDLPKPVQTALAVLGSLVSTTALVGGAALLAASKIAAFQASLLALGFSAAATDRIMKALGVTMKTLGVAAAAAGVVIAVDQIIDAMADAPPTLNAFTDGLAAFARDGRVTGEAAKVLGSDFAQLGEQLDRASQSKWWSTDFGTTNADVQEAREQIAGLDQSLAGLVQSGNAEMAKRAIEGMAAATGMTEKQLEGRFVEYKDALAGVAAESKVAAEGQEKLTTAAQEAADAVGGVDEAVTNSFSSLGAWAEAMGYGEEAIKELTKQVETWAQSYAKFVEPLGAYTELLSAKEAAEQKSAEATAAATASQSDSWEDYAGKVSVSFGEYLAALEKQVKAQQDWSTNMLILSSRVSEGTLDELARMGPEGAPLAAMFVSRSDKELARLETSWGARTKAATDATGAQLRMAGPVLAAVAGAAGVKTRDALARELAEGKTTVARIAEQYGVSISGAIIPEVNRASTNVRQLERALSALDGRRVTFNVTANTAAARAALSAIDGRARAGFASGGYVSGPGTSTSDSIHALLSDGEYVLRASAVDKIGVPELDRLNRYAGGGLVGRYATGGRARPTRGRVSPTGGSSVSALAAGLTSVEQVRALVDAWEDYNDQLAQAARRQELALDEQAARRAFDLAKGMKARTAALEDLKDAQKKLREFDAAAAVDRERKAVDKILDTLVAEEKARDAASRAAEELAEVRERAAEQAEDAQERALDKLNKLLDTEKALRQRQLQAVQRHNAERVRIAARASEQEARFAADQRALRAREAQAEERHLERLAVLRLDLAADETRLLTDRRDQLAGGTALSELVAFERGLPADWLVANARRQIEALAEWMDELNIARGRGVSEQVITALGLDKGPQTLAQVRELTRASATEIDALNDAVEQRTQLAGEQVRREQVGNHGQLGQALLTAQRQYANAVNDLRAEYQSEQQRFAGELVQMQNEYVSAQQQIRQELATAQAELVAEQTQLATELAALGQEQGRSLGEALAAALRSQIPGVRAAAQELADAMSVLGRAQAAVGGTAERRLDKPRADVTGPWKRVGMRQRTYDVGGWLEPGYTLAYNGTGRPERILTAQQMSSAGSRVVQFMPGAAVTIRETADVDLLIQRAEFLSSAGAFE
jgi:TP901 family phage tail tape measure protein